MGEVALGLATNLHKCTGALPVGAIATPSIRAALRWSEIQRAGSFFEADMVPTRRVGRRKPSPAPTPPKTKSRPAAAVNPWHDLPQCVWTRRTRRTGGSKILSVTAVAVAVVRGVKGGSLWVPIVSRGVVDSTVDSP